MRGFDSLKSRGWLVGRSYRAARRNQAKTDHIKFPWPGASAKRIEFPPVRANKRDRSEEAQAQRDSHITIDFTDGVNGISRSLVNRRPGVRFDKKPKRGWAAKRRAAPFAIFFSGDKLEKARMRHKWYRLQKEREAFAALTA